MNEIETKLDFVLKKLQENNGAITHGLIYKSLAEKIKSDSPFKNEFETLNLNNSEFIELLNILNSDGYIIYNVTNEVGFKGEISDLTITLAGKLFISAGGYTQQFELRNRDIRIHNRNEKRLTDYTLFLVIGTFLLVFVEVLIHFRELRCLFYSGH